MVKEVGHLIKEYQNEQPLYLELCVLHDLIVYKKNISEALAKSNNLRLMTRACGFEMSDGLMGKTGCLQEILDEVDEGVRSLHHSSSPID